MELFATIVGGVYLSGFPMTSLGSNMHASSRTLVYLTYVKGPDFIRECKQRESNRDVELT
jgi:hypothetical protein